MSATRTPAGATHENSGTILPTYGPAGTEVQHLLGCRCPSGQQAIMLDQNRMLPSLLNSLLVDELARQMADYGLEASTHRAPEPPYGVARAIRSCEVYLILDVKRAMQQAFDRNLSKAEAAVSKPEGATK